VKLDLSQSNRFAVHKTAPTKSRHIITRQESTKTGIVCCQA